MRSLALLLSMLLLVQGGGEIMAMKKDVSKLLQQFLCCPSISSLYIIFVCVLNAQNFTTYVIKIKQ